ENAGQLGVYGASKVYNVNDASLNTLDSQVLTKVIAEAAAQLGAKVIILSHTSTGKSLLGRLAVRLNAGSVPGVNALPDLSGGFKVKKSVYSGKAVATFAIKSDIKILSLMGNAIRPEASGNAVSVENLSVNVPAAKVTVKETKTVEGTVPLPEAEIVVSAGRGMKGPENWGIIEELADVLGATTACSRPVADAG